MVILMLPFFMSAFSVGSLMADTPALKHVTDLTAALHNVQAQRPGDITCALFASEEGFPMNDKKAMRSVKATGQGDERKCVFQALAEGEYAISVVHDEDGNGKLNTNLFGAPTEGWATSGNVTHALRAPNFAESKFRFSAANPRVDLEMHY